MPSGGFVNESIGQRKRTEAMPVKRRGKQIVEVSTGKVVGRSKTTTMAKKAVQARNIAHSKKRGR